MSETNRTAIYFAAALVVVGLAIFTQPSSSRFDVQEMVGEPLVDEFELDAPKRLSVTRVDAETSERRDFEVAERGGNWTIPSKGGYPADATDNMVNAVEGVIGRQILAVATDEPGRHAEFGVLDPTTSDSAADAESVGTRVKLTGADDKALADVIIGKEVKETDGKQRYVRLASQDVVYVVEIDPSSFSTDFGDWIEKDLLNLNTMEIAGIDINDYSAAMEFRLTNQGLRPIVTQKDRGRYELNYDDENSKWQVVSLESFDEAAGKYEPFELGEGEELNDDSLRELRNALADLKIVDVDRKPAGLSADLKAGADFIKDQTVVQNLAARGFIPVGGSNGTEILSSDGELIVTLNSGVEYVLRFGDIEQTDAVAGDAGDKSGDEATVEDDENDGTLSRYLFVMARLNEAAIERPELEELPPLPEEKFADETNDAEGEVEAEGEGEAPAEPETAGEEQGEAAGGGADAPKKPTNADEIAKIKAVRAAIEDRNNAALKQFDTELADARERVEELNRRFGDWYYVVGNDVFKKIHLSRDQIIKSAADPAAEVDESSSPLGLPGGPIPGLPGLPTIPPMTDNPATQAEGEAPAEPATEAEGEAAAESAADQEGEAAAEPATDAEGEAAAEPATEPEGEAAADPALEEESKAPVESEAEATDDDAQP